jgi:cell division protease FtsH
VVGGPARRGKVISEKEKKITAYHEGGHALAAWAMPGLEPVYKVTILPRGRTGGHALVVPEDDKSLMTRSEMIARLVMAMGGRAAEELVFAEPTTGASSDIAQATKIARAMVTEYGMSAKLGAVKYGHGDDEPFLGRTYGSGPEYSIEVGSEIDGEVRALIEAAHTEAWAVLNTYRDILDSLATALLEKETLERRDLEVIFAEVEKRPRITTFDEFGPRLPSDRPPIKTPGELAIERGEPWPPPERLPEAVDAPPVPVGAVSGYPGQSGYNTGPGFPQGGSPDNMAGQAPGQQQPPPANWTGGVLPGPLAPMPGWQQGPDQSGPQKTLGGYRGGNGGHPAGPPNGGHPAGPPNGGQGPVNGGPNGAPNGVNPYWTGPDNAPQGRHGERPPIPNGDPNQQEPIDPWLPPRDHRS